MQVTRTYIEMQDINRDGQHLIVYSGRKARKEIESRGGSCIRGNHERRPLPWIYLFGSGPVSQNLGTGRRNA